MAIRIKKEESGSFARVSGVAVEPIPVNSYVCGASAAEGKITISNPEQTVNGDDRTLISDVPFTEFVKSDGSIPADAADLVADISAQLTQAAPTDVNAGYRGNYNPVTNSPDLSADIDDYNNGDLFFSTGEASVDLGDGAVLVQENDQLKLSVDYDSQGVEVSRRWNLIKNTSPSIAQIESSSINHYDVVIDSSYTGQSEGTAFRPWKDIATGIANTQPNDTVLILGEHEISAAVELPHGLRIDGVRNTTVIKYAVWNKSNSDIFYHEGDGSQAFVFNNFRVERGRAGLRIEKAADVRVTGVLPTNNGWSGQGLNTALSSGTSGMLGFDSLQGDLQAFAAGPEVSPIGVTDPMAGGILLIECKNFVIRDCISTANLRSVRVQDCGRDGGYGIIMDCRASGNLESGFYRAAGALGGCENVTIINCISAFNGNNGFLDVAAFNCEISQVKSFGNWSAAHYNWASANLTVRDFAFYNCNRSGFNAIGNIGDSLASMGIADAFSYLGSIISFNPDYRFIQKNINGQIHYTGFGSNVQKIGVKLIDSLNGLGPNVKNKIDFENCDFIGQEVDIDFSEVDLTNLHVCLDGNLHQDVGELAIEPPLAGHYYEMPFSNMATSYQSVDFSASDDSGNVVISEGVNGNTINIYQVGQLLAIEFNGGIRIIQKDSYKIQFEVPADGCSIGGVALSGSVDENVDSLNSLLQATGAPAGEVPVVTSALAVSMVQGSTLNYELTASYAVAYEWDFSNVPGVTSLNGNIRKIIGGSDLAVGSYSIPVKAINYNGVDSETINLIVNSPSSFSNSKSVLMSHQDNLKMVNDAGGLLPALERSANNSGEAWSISMRMKPANDSRSQIWLFAGQTSYNLPYLELKQIDKDGLRFRYGQNGSGEFIQIELDNVLNVEDWNHVLITFSGGDTSSANVNRGDEFQFFVNGVEITGFGHSGSGFSDALEITRVRVGRTFNSNSIKNGYIDELATFGNNQSGNIAALSAAPSDLSATASTWHRFGDGVNDGFPYIYDQIDVNDDDRRLQMQGQTSANIVNDAP